MKSEIKIWNKEEFGNIHIDKEQLQIAMQRIQQKIIEEWRMEEKVKEEGEVLIRLEENRRKFCGAKSQEFSG